MELGLLRLVNLYVVQSTEYSHCGGHFMCSFMCCSPACPGRGTVILGPTDLGPQPNQAETNPMKILGFTFIMLLYSMLVIVVIIVVLVVIIIIIVIIPFCTVQNPGEGTE